MKSWLGSYTASPNKIPGGSRTEVCLYHEASGDNYNSIMWDFRVAYMSMDVPAKLSLISTLQKKSPVPLPHILYSSRVTLLIL